MNSRLSLQMTLLGVCALVFYGGMAAGGQLSFDLLPQFVVSAVVFIAAGSLLRRPGRVRSEDEEVSAERPRDPELTERDWSYFTVLLNWGMALFIIACLAVWVMKPLEMPFKEYLLAPVDHEQVLSRIIAP